MTDRLSRRDLMVLAGSGLAVSGCTLQVVPKTGSRGSLDDAKRRYPYDVKSACENYGMEANTPASGGNFPVDFRAPYICIIHISLSDGWKIWVNWASFDMEGDFSPVGRLEKAKEVLAERFLPNPTPAPPPPPPPPTRFSELTKNPPWHQLDHLGFKNFGFANQHELFFFFDNTGVVLDDRLLVVFTERPLLDSSTQIHKNYSFIEAKSVNESEMGTDLYAKGRMFRMRNYVQFEGGGPILAGSGHHQTYSMNIHFKVAAGTNEWLPMTIDPETGNGAGHEP